MAATQLENGVKKEKKEVWTETFVHNGDVSLYVKYNHTAKERPNRPTVLFVHGYPDDHRVWSYQMESLKEDYNVAALDLRGSGKSDKPKKQKAYNVRRIFEDLESVIRFVGNDKPVHLVAHDWGSLISWAFVADEEKSVWAKSYTAMGGPHPVLGRRSAFQMALSGNPLSLYKALSQLKRSWYILYFQIPFVPEWIWKTFSKFFWKYTMNTGGVPKNDTLRNKSKEEIVATTVSNVNLYRELLRGEKYPEPKHIKAPVQVLIPLKDFAIRPELYRLHERICDSYKEYTYDSNHWIQRTMPDMVSEKIREFVWEIG
ncbi:alpha/beta fold hydrolase [Leptospira selangorensis]|uniref:Alpha/beta fold hydrolase n=1 Tax=Leptospira selangorensis TaxID=2484982 RepID=A0A5F2BVC7_9LEPT|nr:alpha/beta fold hydrolase [Leptospira selangorensis]TGM11872.1 alpha/beta fold hydrolase [Leptospira selangorensis]TGM15269.1 alpha/beta fold hydrolase [Leptospira selangorensis]